MPASIPVVLMLGQSNMRRFELPLGAAENIAAKGGIVVHHAVSGAPLSAGLDQGNGDWSASDDPGAGEHLEGLLGRIDAILDPASPTYIPGAYVAGAIWVQGEADSASTAASGAYRDNLLELRETLVAAYGDHEWAVAALSENVWQFRTNGLNREPMWSEVRDAQLALDDADGFSTIDTDALGETLGMTTETMFEDDYVHYTDTFGHALGEALADTLDFEGDAILHVGTSSNDVFTIAPTGTHQVFGSAGTDSADFSALGSGINVTAYAPELAAVDDRGGDPDFMANLIGVERITGTDHADVFRLSTNVRDIRTGDGNDVAVGGDHNDVMRMENGDDVAHGLFGNDVILGGHGNDTLAGHDGNDRLYGGNDDDRILAGAGDDLIIGGRGDDEIRPHQGNDIISYGVGPNGSDTVYGFSARDDQISFEGLDLSADDIFLSAEDSDLRIRIETENVEADIRLINRANLADEDEDRDWLIY